jgi:hypothetical protein
MHPIKEQFLRDMPAAGHASTTQTRYLENVDAFFKAVWTSPEQVTENMVKDFLIAVRDRAVARETFRNYFYALKFFFLTTMRRAGPSLKKTPSVPPLGSVCATP